MKKEDISHIRNRCLRALLVEKSNQKGDQRMNSLSTILSSSTGTQASGGSSVMFIVVYIAIFAAIIYFMMIRPQKKQKAKTDQMLSQMEPGDNIMTTSGFYGTILDVVDDSTIIVEFGNNKNCRIRCV